MEMRSKRIDKYSMQRALSVLGGIALNVALSYLIHRLGIPLYLDTIGTIGVAAVSGLFPGIMAALATNVFCALFNRNSIYFALLNVLIAICASWCAQKGLLKKLKGIAAFILAASFIGGGLGALVQLALLGEPQFEAVKAASDALSGALGSGRFLSFLAVNIGLNLVDKTISACVALFAARLIPEERRRAVWNSGWRQAPLSEREIREFREARGSGRRSLQTRMTMMLMLAAVALTVVSMWISLVLYNRDAREERIRAAYGAAQQAVEAVDPRLVDYYLEHGAAGQSYADVEGRLQSIRDNTPHIKYIYVYKIREDGCHVVFDAVPQGEETDKAGEVIAFDPAFVPYLPALLSGERIEPVESNDSFGWLLTVYQPIYAEDGSCAAYAGADVDMSGLRDYVRDYLMRTLLIFSGFFIMVLAYGLWVSRIYLIYPIDSMVACVEDFMAGDVEQESLDEGVKKLRALDIRTGDEVEKLYRAICRMTLNAAEQMREIRHFAQVNEKMQDGLIITMADMVENRDSDTGAHIQKTAAYVKIILEGLKAKGYYPEKLSARYRSDVVMSAPLHDVGKISIPDAVLNKPGKLTDEEFAIMKTHTTAGKEILERAISTVKGENYLKEARNMAAYHHERWDGKGYPEGLHGEVIPLSARVMAVADVFDALTSPRVYKPPFPLEKALQMIHEGAGTQFDPKCVEAFEASLAEVKLVLKKYQGM